MSVHSLHKSNMKFIFVIQKGIGAQICTRRWI